MLKPFDETKSDHVPEIMTVSASPDGVESVSAHSSAKEVASTTSAVTAPDRLSLVLPVAAPDTAPAVAEEKASATSEPETNPEDADKLQAANDDFIPKYDNKSALGTVSPTGEALANQLRQFAIRCAEVKESPILKADKPQPAQGGGGGLSLKIPSFGLGLGISGLMAHRKNEYIASTMEAAVTAERIDRLRSRLPDATGDEKARIERSLRKDSSLFIKNITNGLTPESIATAKKAGMSEDDLLNLKSSALKWASTMAQDDETRTFREKIAELFKKISDYIKQVFSHGKSEAEPTPA